MSDATPTDDGSTANDAPDAADAGEGDPSTDGADDPASYHGARAALYATLAGAFAYPTESTVAELSAPETREGLRTAAERLPFLDRETAVDYADALDRVDADALGAAYNDLFGVPDDGGTYAVVPYEAHYTVADDVSDRQRRIATVSGLLDAFGLERDDEFDERHDHVTVELELAQVLAGRRAVAAEVDDLEEQAADLERAESTLLVEHLAPFVPAFAGDLREALDCDAAAADGDALAAYEAAATLAEALVVGDAADRSASAAAPGEAARPPAGGDGGERR